MHNNILAGHLMLDKTIARVRRRYFWPFQTTVDRFIASCEPCQLANHPHTTPKARLRPIQIQVSRTLELVTSDYLGPLKRSRNGNTNIIVICDQKSKYAWFKPTRNQEAKTTAPIYVKIQMEFGIFEKLLTDKFRIQSDCRNERVIRQ